ncbi:MAG: DUF1295 domain-containing protein [Cyclobacteriaceae bacterium]
MSDKHPRYSRLTSFLIVTIGYVVAIATGIYAAKVVGYNHTIYDVAVADVIATLVIFIFSFVLKNSSMYDPYWSVIPIPIAYYWMTVFPEGNEIRQWMVLFLVAFWGIRLTLNWMRGWPGLHHEDWRYVDLAEKNGKAYWLVSFSGIHMFPTILVFAGMLPVWVAMQSEAPIGLIDYLAFIITLAAVIMEWISDEQLKAYKMGTHESGAFIKSGLWAYSRHPNYFGEVSFWVGLSVFSVGLSLDYYWTGVGALAMIILFVFISIPMMDERHKVSRKGYDEHMKKVSALVPWFRKE